MSNAHVHPLFRGFCAAASGDALRQASAAVQRFHVLVHKRGAPPLHLEVEGVDKASVQDQHMDQALLGGGAVQVFTDSEWRARAAHLAKVRAYDDEALSQQIRLQGRGQ